MQSIVLVVPYFGKLPTIFPLWLLSVRYNPTIDVLLLTDDQTPYDYPVNVRKINMNFNECRTLIQSKYNFLISLPKPYKLCDYKPAYGYIFSEYIKQYDFWGFCDVDLIFGNLRHFLTEELLQQYDRLFFHGHFALTRNTDICNHIYENKIDGCDYYQDVFQDPGNLYFDEYIMGHSSTRIWESIDPDHCYKEQPYDDVFPPMWKGNNTNFNTISHHGLVDCLFYKYLSGSLFRIFLKDGKQVEEETMYVHLQKRFIQLSQLAESFVLIPNQIISNITSISVIKQIEYCRKHPVYELYGNFYHFFQLKWHQFISK